MSTKRSLCSRFLLPIFLVAAFTIQIAHGAPLKIGYSDWPGWVAWEIGIKKGWFKEEGVEVEFVWMDYVKSVVARVLLQSATILWLVGCAGYTAQILWRV